MTFVTQLLVILTFATIFAGNIEDYREHLSSTLEDKEHLSENTFKELSQLQNHIRHSKEFKVRRNDATLYFSCTGANTKALFCTLTSIKPNNEETQRFDGTVKLIFSPNKKNIEVLSLYCADHRPRLAGGKFWNL